MINMQELQIKQKDEEFSHLLLKKGNGVTSFQVNKMVNDFFDYKTPGLPYFKPIKLENYKTSNKMDWNKMFGDIKEDLENAFIVYNNQTDYEVIINGDYDMRMESANKAIDSLVYQTQLLEEYTEKKVAYTPYIIDFNDLSNVNTTNLTLHNIPYTTSEIDFDSSTLRNELLSTPGDKIDLSKSAILLNCTHSKIVTNKDVSAIINETLNDTVAITTTSQSQTPSSLVITVVFENIKEISRVNLIGYCVYNSNISLYLSEDGTNFFEKKTSKGDTNMTWRFNSIELKAVKIVIEKTNYDYVNEEENTCYFMISNLSMYIDKYEKTSVYTSKVIEVDEMISDVTLDPVHELQPGTDISYYIGYENKDDNIDWKIIKPRKQLDLGLLYKEELILNYQTLSYSEFGVRIYNKILKEFYFRVHRLPENTNVNSIELRAGHTQWLIERLDVSDKYPVPADGSDAIPTDNKCHTNDYSKARVTAISPLDAQITELRCEKKNNYFVMSQYAICSEEKIITNRYIDFVPDSNEVFDTILLINGRQVFPKNGKYTFKLKKGENIVQLMILLAGLDTTKTDSNGSMILNTIKHNFNLISYCDDIFAGPKMQRISYNSLLKNISNQSLKFFSVKEENYRLSTNDPDDIANTIVTKFDVNYVLKSEDPLMYDKDAVTVNNSHTRAKIMLAASINPVAITGQIQPRKTFDDIINQPYYDENNDVVVPEDGEHLPKYHIQDVYMNNSEYFRMYIKYKHMLPKVKEKITNSSGNSNIRLRVMAKLSTSDVTVTPAIKAIKVIGE